MRKEKRPDDDEEILKWLESNGVKITEIEDKAFKKLIFDSMNRQDNWRRFEIHNTDLIYCLRMSWLNKMRPREFSEKESEDIWHWFRGKGGELGVVNTMKGLLKDEVKTQKKVNIGKSMGSVDLELYGVPYELTTRMFYGSLKNPKKLPPLDKVIQNISYAVADNKMLGRVQVHIMAPPKEESTKVREKDDTRKFEIKEDVKKHVRTWDVSLSLKGLNFFRNLFIQRSEIFDEALETGHWSILPKAYFSWRCERCVVASEGKKMSGCEFMETHKSELKWRWREWKVQKSKFLRDKCIWLLKHSGQEMFEKVYERKPDKEELEAFKKVVVMIIEERMRTGEKL